MLLEESPERCIIRSSRRRLVAKPDKARVTATSAAENGAEREDDIDG
jgi:hypothetical protein